MLRKITAVIVCMIFTLQFTVISSGDLPENQGTQTTGYWPSRFRLGTQYSTEGDRSIFYLDYLFPLFYSQDENTLVFFNPKQTWSHPHSDELNLGAGIRQIFDDDYILGMHIFYDKKHSINKLWHEQIGVGLEYLSEPLDVRINYYHPITDAKELSGTNFYSLGEINLIRWKNLEEPLQGVDLEAGFPILPEGANTRLYLGGFFYSSDYADDVNGFRARTETDIWKWLALDTVFNLKPHGETEFICGLRVTIPLELGRMLSLDNPLETMPQPSYIKERLLERVVRDIDIQSQVTQLDDIS